MCRQSQLTFTFAIAQDRMSIQGARDEAGQVERMSMKRVGP